jgi:DNA-directed DNA polymerase III PolC
MTAFTPLRVRSHGSLLEGVASPEALIERALDTGLDALALTDRDNLYLAVRFMNAASAEGLKPLTGALISHGGHEALLLAADRRGYARLCTLLTRRHLDERFDLITALGGPADGLHVIVESAGLAAALIAGGVQPACAEAGPLAPGPRGAPATGLWMGVRGIGGEVSRLAARIDGARSLGVPLIATGDIVMIAPRDHEAHRVAVTAARGELIERMTPASFAAADAWFAPPAEWTRRVRVVCTCAGRPEAADEALAHNAALVTRCRLKLEMGVPIFPRAPLASGETGEAKLRRLALEGATWRYRSAGETARAAAHARLDQELGVIERMGFTDYFLLVAEIVGFARDQNIPTVGRGSGASSIVAYVLGITNVDPIRYGLHFERFLNPSRRDCPDLDIDLCWKRRDEVIAHVYRAYGADRVAMISTHATLGARSAFRETAKALGVPNARVNQLARRIPRELEPPYAQRLAVIAAARGVDWSEGVLARALALAERLSGAPRHLSVHSGGIVIADRELTHYVPLERAAKDVVVTQFEMRAIEAIGLVKMDLLGNRALTTIGDCISLARGGAGNEAPPELDAIPEHDALTGARVAAGDTLNCFQLESPAMRHLLRMLRADTLPATILGVALVRPGPAGSPGGEGRDRNTKETFCRRQRGLEPATFLHPSLESVLRSTHGLMLYEEDVMRVAAAFAGLTLAQGDDLRRAIAHARGDEEFRSLERGFVAHAVRAGADETCAHAVWRELTRFAAYAFCHAHAAGYGTLGWQSAYLKTRYPTEWAVGVLNHHAGMYPTWVHVEDLRRHGVEFRGPCAARSEIDTTLERDERSAAQRGDVRRNDAVRVGLSRVAGLSAAAGGRIVAARRSRSFASLQDVLERARPDAGEIEALILSGALDFLARTRPSLLLEARVTAARAPVPGATRRALEREPALAMAGGASLMPDPVAPVAAPELPEFDIAERVRGEMSSTGLWFSAHPLDVFVDAEAQRTATPAAALAAYAGRRVTLVGMLCAWRRVETKSGGVMLFATLADRSGLAECALFPAVYREFAEAMTASIVRIEGRVDETLDSVTVAVERAAPAGLNPSAFLPSRGS